MKNRFGWFLAAPFSMEFVIVAVAYGPKEWPGDAKGYVWGTVLAFMWLAWGMVLLAEPEYKRERRRGGDRRKTR